MAAKKANIFHESTGFEPVLAPGLDKMESAGYNEFRNRGGI